MTEDRNNVREADISETTKWRSTSGAAEDRNAFKLDDVDRAQVVAVALRSSQGLQRPVLVRGQRCGWWSRYGTTANRNGCVSGQS